MYLKKIVQRYFSFILIQKKIHIFYLTTWFFISFPRTKLKPHGFSFLFHEEKKRNKDELLRTMSEKKSPAFVEEREEIPVFFREDRKAV